jgi:hypothetical protein
VAAQSINPLDWAAVAPSTNLTLHARSTSLAGRAAAQSTCRKASDPLGLEHVCTIFTRFL